MNDSTKKIIQLIGSSVLTDTQAQIDSSLEAKTRKQIDEIERQNHQLKNMPESTFLAQARKLSDNLPRSREEEEKQLIESSGLSMYQNLLESTNVTQEQKYLNESKHQPTPDPFSEPYHPPQPKQITKEEVVINNGDIYMTDNSIKIGNNNSVGGNIAAADEIKDSFNSSSPDKEGGPLNFIAKNNVFILIVLVLCISAVLVIGFYLINSGVITNETINNAIDKFSKL